MSPDPHIIVNRKADIHRRLLEAYRALDAKDAKREFRRALARAVGRSEQSVARWVGERQEVASPVSGSLDAVERWLDGGCK